MGGVRFPSNLVSATLLRRLNRFAVEVELDRRPVVAHLANSGRLAELMFPGTPALLVPKAGPQRKTAFDLLLVRIDGRWVSADARLPNALVREALAKGQIGPLRGYAVLRPEAPFAGSRVDFLLRGPKGLCLLEAKSVTLVVDGVGLFPDAPTGRGQRHMETLLEAWRQGMEAAVLFIVQRGDAVAFRPNDEADPTFGRLLREAAAAGVAVLAYRCQVSPRAIRIGDPLPVRL